MVQAVSTPARLLRGAQAITDYLNSKLEGGRPVSRAATYRMIENGKLPVKKLGEKGAEIWANTRDLDALLGLGEAYESAES